jgi:predicted ATP-grasp superfamily ATP-dependent carboligase
LALPGEPAPRTGRWLVKPLYGAGGAGIRFGPGGAPLSPGQRVYLQEFIEGDSCAAVYVGDEPGARLLGVTRQLTGERWLHARAFAYCGSIGPLPVSPVLRATLEHLGEILVKGSGLRGLFGVDLIVNEAGPWVVEVNPRYTASVEVLEYALGISAVGLHRRVFEPGAARGEKGRVGFVGKAILFARASLTFPADGPWQSPGTDPWQLPELADIPPAGQCIEVGRPVLTFFAHGDSPADCRGRLQQIAADLDRRIFG